MNTAFGNPKGDPTNIDWNRVRKQCLNIPDEIGELFIALGASQVEVMNAVRLLKKAGAELSPTSIVDVDEVRDALCDVQVFAQGAQHFIGVDGDADMAAVVAGVMTRFVKDEADLNATIQLHRAKGVEHTYVEGEFPTMVLKSAVDQPDAPKGKFLKSASYSQTVFPPLSGAGTDAQGNDALGEGQ
jgi:hypothetical protein